MEEDVGVKAPVTRLRRRLSVEQAEDVSSPATPTKKRGGRLAAKPQLDLIEENAQISSPRKPRRKSIVKDVADEEKPVTPSRRSTRIKSNSSIVLETLTAQTTDSPRARRALRRNSQAGSDNEGPATPARQRRTRKDSTSSVENQDPAKEPRPLLQVPEMVITEEPENEVQVTANKSKSSPRAAAEDLSPNSARKSKRLSEKRNRRSGSYKSESDTNANSEGNKSLNSSTKKEKSETKPKSSDLSNKSYENIEVTDKLSQSNTSLLNSVDTEQRVLVSNHNKSTSDLKPKNIDKKKRIRTESWPSVTIPNPNDSVVFSDNEYAKKKKKKAANSSNISNSDLNNISIKVDDKDKNKKETSVIESNSKRRTSERSITTDLENASEVIQPTQITKTDDVCSINKEKTSDKPEHNDIRCEISMLFKDTPNNVQAIVYFEDSDSNGVNSDAANKVKQLDSEDQCVPVVKHDIELEDKLSTKTSNTKISKEVILTNQSTIDNDLNDTNNSKKSIDRINDSCEPMDVDETIPEDVLHKTQNSLLDSNTNHNQNTRMIEESNKSKRKSSSSISAPDTLDKSKIENKSTLILSQIKDVSTTSENSLKSPKKVINEIMSKSVLTNTGANNTNNEITKANLSLNDLKGTPLRQKDMLKLNMQTSTPITALTTNKNINVSDKRKSDSKTPDLSKSINESSDENSDESDEASKTKSKYLDDEAEEASGDYESGDSQDEEERQYEDENQIVERGETLGSDDDVSNDTDYERDSFVVSSDAEDNELLSGSGEDLSMSDNELTMSKRSKQKFNERKLKEQKNASREMFESRHKLNTSEPKSPVPKTKSNRMRIDSSLLESDEEVVVKPKKGNRLRLESSTLDVSMKKEDANVSNKKANKTINNESSINEKEITVCNDITDAKDPLLVEFKKEPNTPQKDLNISVVQFTATQEIENVEVAESNSILNETKTDPLQETITNEDSDSSESEEILQNYDSVLDELNKNKRLKLNYNNNSLNIGKKKKNNTSSEPIVDQLNLTNSKKLKNVQKEESQDVVDSKSKMAEQPQKKHDLDSEDESNSIDLQLLFSEDNCGSGDENVNDRNNQQKEGGDENMFIPLKKSTEMNTSQQNTSLNESIKKKNKRKSSINFNESPLETEDTDKPELNTSTKKKKNRKSSVTETVEEHQDSDKPELNTSTKKKNRKSLVTEPVEEHQDSNKPDLNTSTKKKNRKSSVTEPVEEHQDSDKPNLNTSTKKKNRKSSVTEPVEEHQDSDKPNLNTSTKKKNRKSSVTEPVEEHQDSDKPNLNTSTKKKNRKSSVTEPVEEHQDSDKPNLNTSTKKKNRKSSVTEPVEEHQDSDKPNLNTSTKKKNRKSSVTEPVEEHQDSANPDLNTSTKKKNRKSSVTELVEGDQESTNDGEPELNESIKKKKKRKSSLVPQEAPEPEGDFFFFDTTGTVDADKEDNGIIYNIAAPGRPTSEKKKKNKKKEKLHVDVSQNMITGKDDDDSDGAPVEVSYRTEKACDLDGMSQNTEGLEAPETESGKKKKKKKKKSAALNQSAEATKAEVVSLNNSKKRKRKASDTQGNLSQDAQEITENTTLNESLSTGSHKKKRKTSHNDEASEHNPIEAINILDDEKRSGKKKKKRELPLSFQNMTSEPETTQTVSKKNKKRKDRDEDNVIKKTKVSKDNSLQEVHLPPLPASILSQLDDTPCDKNKVISTSKFVVENARQKRAKPSNFLEESVYLDESSPLAKKVKPRMKKPKVLPFIPTASISDSGFTTNFKINKLSQNIQFVAEPTGIAFSKERYLQKDRIKRLGTFELYKKQIHKRLSKF